jgi:hypothetical protein
MDPALLTSPSRAPRTCPNLLKSTPAQKNVKALQFSKKPFFANISLHYSPIFPSGYIFLKLAKSALLKNIATKKRLLSVEPVSQKSFLFRKANILLDLCRPA